jgi:hypothetical protein
MRHAITLFALILVGTLAAQAEPPHPTPANDVEMVDGVFRCTARVSGQFTGDLSGLLHVSGTIEGEYSRNLYNTVRRANNVGKCSELVDLIRAKAEEHGCVTGALESPGVQNGIRLRFPYACTGRRSEVVEALYEMSAEMFEFLKNE